MIIATMISMLALQADPATEGAAGVFQDMGHMMIYAALIALTCAAGAAWLMIKLQKRRDATGQTTSINPARQKAS